MSPDRSAFEVCHHNLTLCIFLQALVPLPKSRQFSAVSKNSKTLLNTRTVRETSDQGTATSMQSWQSAYLCRITTKIHVKTMSVTSGKKDLLMETWEKSFTTQHPLHIYKILHKYQQLLYDGNLHVSLKRIVRWQLSDKVVESFKSDNIISKQEDTGILTLTNRQKQNKNKLSGSNNSHSAPHMLLPIGCSDRGILTAKPWRSCAPDGKNNQTQGWGWWWSPVEDLWILCCHQGIGDVPSRSVVQVVARSEELWSSISLKTLSPERPERGRWPEDAVPALLTNSPLLDSSSCHHHHHYHHHLVAVLLASWPPPRRTRCPLRWWWWCLHQLP